MDFGFRCSSFYNVLGVSPDSSLGEIRRAYRKLAMQWHPDKWTRNPSLLGKAKRKFQEIQQAYSVLSDQRKKTLYDAGLFNPYDKEDEGFYDFMGEMLSLMQNVRREGKEYSLEDLQGMINEMMDDFQSPVPPPPPSPPSWCFNHTSSFDDSRREKRARFNLNSTMTRTDLPVYGFGLFDSSSYRF